MIRLGHDPETYGNHLLDLLRYLAEDGEEISFARESPDYIWSLINKSANDMRFRLLKVDKRFIFSYDSIFGDIIDIMSCLRNKQDVKLLKSIFHDVDSIEQRVIFSNFNTNGLSYSTQKLVKKFFEHYYNDPYIYEIAIKLGGIDLGI